MKKERHPANLPWPCLAVRSKSSSGPCRVSILRRRPQFLGRFLLLIAFIKHEQAKLPNIRGRDRLSFAAREPDRTIEHTEPLCSDAQGHTTRESTGAVQFSLLNFLGDSFARYSCSSAIESSGDERLRYSRGLCEGQRNTLRKIKSRWS